MLVDFFVEANRTLNKEMPVIEFPNNRLLYLSIGLATETNELKQALNKWLLTKREDDKLKIIEEIGDQLWYLIQFYRFLFPESNENIIETITAASYKLWGPSKNYMFLVDYIQEQALDCLEHIKKVMFQGHQLNTIKLSVPLRRIYITIIDLCNSLDGIDLKFVLQCNVDKLKRRYPGGFSYEKSTGREENEKNAR